MVLVNSFPENVGQGSLRTDTILPFSDVLRIEFEFASGENLGSAFSLFGNFVFIGVFPDSSLSVA